MIRVRTTIFDPGRLHDALAGASTVYVDLETTGLTRHDRIVAAGVLIDRDAHVIVTDEHRDLSSANYRVGNSEFLHALEPLARPDLTTVFHHAAFDMGMLERAGVRVGCRIHDTMKLLKLSDPDRGAESGEEGTTGTRRPRFDRQYREALNYRLKDVARHMLNFTPLEFPGDTATVPLDRLTSYLKSDLLITQELHRRLLKRLGVADLHYADSHISPIAPLLVRMSIVGVEAELEFIVGESKRLLDLMARISAEHDQRYGQKLDVGDYHLRGWVYFRGLRCRRILSGKASQLSLRNEDLLRLWHESGDAAVKESLALIHDYQLARGLMRRLSALQKHVDGQSRRIYSKFDDFQASGRVSSTQPNLQQIARTVGPRQKKEFRSQAFAATVVQSRNAIVASEGFMLVAFDVAQADIRNLAHAVESFNQDGKEFIEELERRRLERLSPAVRKLHRRIWKHFRAHNRKPLRCPACRGAFVLQKIALGSPLKCPNCGADFIAPDRRPSFDPSAGSALADDFRRGGTDFYSVAVERMLGRPPRKGTSEREHMKQTILGIINGMGVESLAKRLQVPKATATEYLAKFAAAYPEVVAFTKLMQHAFALTGDAHTFARRPRRSTAHHWMVTRSVVELFISYRRADKLWLRVVPLEVDRHTLKCWVLRVVDAKRGSPNEGLEIYNHKMGRISQLPYRFFDDAALIFGLPVRNVAWRIIRRVRTGREEAVYEGFDRVARQLFNHIAQGGTADLAKQMMLRAEPICSKFGARMLLQIHDELVFEVPVDRWRSFTRLMKAALERPPCDGYRVPIVVEPKSGQRFGEMRKLGPVDLWDSRISRFFMRFVRTARRDWKRLVSSISARTDACMRALLTLYRRGEK